MVKNPPVMQETWVQSLSWENPLEEGMTTHSSILAWRIYPVCTGKEVRFDTHLEGQIIQACVRDGKSCLEI